jgi:transposase-like protein
MTEDEGTAPALVDIYRGLTAHGKDVTMPTKYPEEFKRDVVAVARTSGLSQDQIARDFGISTHSVQRWLKQADIDDGVVEGTTSSEQDELTALKRRNRVLEQEVEILRRATAYFAKDAAPK